MTKKIVIGEHLPTKFDRHAQNMQSNLRKLKQKKLTFNREITFPYSFRMFLLNSLLRTGKVENNFSTVTVVPTCRAIFVWLATTPECSNSKCVPTGSSLVLVSTVSFPSAQSELSASPRNPNVTTDPRSEKSDILEVWCLSASAY